MSSRHVRSVVIGGADVYTEGSFPFETAPIYERARESASRLWNRMDEII
jgi:hypothetical protein